MDNVVYLKTTNEEWRQSLEQMKDTKITHAVIAYRNENGDLGYLLHGYEDLTYLIGMMERTKIHMHIENSSFEED